MLNVRYFSCHSGISYLLTSSLSANLPSFILKLFMHFYAFLIFYKTVLLSGERTSISKIRLCTWTTLFHLYFWHRTAHKILWLSVSLLHWQHLNLPVWPRYFAIPNSGMSLSYILLPLPFSKTQHVEINSLSLPISLNHPHKNYQS